VGGSDAARGAFPWHADLNGCGGAVVDELHVVTAAHCIQDDKGLVGDVVHFGHVYSLFSGQTECTRQTRSVIRVQVHPCYCGVQKCGSIFELQHDIAVITLDAPLFFNEFVQPICLPIFNTEVGVGLLATVSGFGHLDYDSGERADSLQFVRKPIVSAARCDQMHADPTTDDMICAGYPEGGRDACIGDSGGPLVVIPDEDCEVAIRGAVLIGVVSWGVKCADIYPGIYSKVAHARDWIDEALTDVNVVAAGRSRRKRRRKKRRRRRRNVRGGGTGGGSDQGVENSDFVSGTISSNSSSANIDRDDRDVDGVDDDVSDMEDDAFDDDGEDVDRDVIDEAVADARPRGPEGNRVTRFDSANCAAYLSRRRARVDSLDDTATAMTTTEPCGSKRTTSTNTTMTMKTMPTISVIESSTSAARPSPAWTHLPVYFAFSGLMSFLAKLQ